MCVVEIQVHARASTKICHTHIPTRLAGYWDREPLGCCGNPSPLVGTLDEISTYISSDNYMQTHTRTLALFCIFFVFLTLQAEISPSKFNKDLNKSPSQHVAPCNGNTGYSAHSDRG